MFLISEVLRKELGYDRSTGADITHNFNQYIAGENYQKKPNNISRALRENDIVNSEKWLLVHPSKGGNLFSLDNEWKKYWNQYFNPDNLFNFSSQ